MGWPTSDESARNAAGVAAMGPAAAVVVVCVALLDDSSFPRTNSKTTNAAASAIASTAPMRTLDRRAQPVSPCSLIRARIGRRSTTMESRAANACLVLHLGAQLGGPSRPTSQGPDRRLAARGLLAASDLN